MRNIKKKICISIAVFFVIALSAIMIYFFMRNNDHSFKTVEVQQARTELNGYTFGEYKNIKFDCDPPSGDWDNIYQQLDIKQYSDFAGSMEQLKQSGSELLSLMCGISVSPTELSDTDKDIYGDRNMDVTCIIDKKLIFDYFYNNSFLIDYIDGISNVMGENAKVIRRLRPSEITEDMIYNVGGEKYPLKDAVSFAQSKIDSVTEKYFFGQKPVLTDIAIVHFPDTDEYSYLFRYSHVFEGLHIDDIAKASPEGEYLGGSYLNLEIRQKDRIFHAGNYGYNVIGDKKSAKRIIPLSEAEKLASKTLAPEHEYHVSRCELKYVCVTQNEAEKASFCPMWVFTLQEDENGVYGYNSDNFEKMNLYINAITGEAYIYEIESQQLIKQ